VKVAVDRAPEVRSTRPASVDKESAPKNPTSRPRAADERDIYPD